LILAHIDISGLNQPRPSHSTKAEAAQQTDKKAGQIII